MRRTNWILLASLVFLAMALRVAHNREIAAADPLARAPMGDERTFLDWSHRVATGKDTETPYQSPLYPTLLGALERAGADTLGTARWLQALLGIGAAGLAALVAWEVARDRRVALVAFVLTAFARPLVHAEGTLLREAPSAAVLAAVALAYARARERARAEDHIALGLALGLGVVLRENFAVVALAVLAERLLHVLGARAQRRELLLGLAMLLVALAVPVLPFDAKVARLGGGVQLLPNWNQGCVFYLANRRDNPTDAGYMPPSFVKLGNAESEIEGFSAEARRRVGHDLTSHEVGRFWLREGLSEVASDPLAYARRVAIRLLASLSPGEAAHQRDLEVDAERSWVLRAPLLDMGVLVALALVGSLSGLPRPGPRRGALIVLAGAWWVSLLAAAYTSRYRVPATPVLAVLGALGARDVARLIAERRAGRVALAALVVLAVLGLRFGRSPAEHSNAWLTRGHAGYLVGDYRSATVDFARYLEARPDDRTALYLLGDSARHVEPVRARAAFSRLVALEPSRVAAWHGLGIVELRLGRPHAAVAALERADTNNRDVVRLLTRARALAARGPDAPVPPMPR